MKNAKSRNGRTLEDRVLEYLERNSTTSVRQLHIENPDLTESEITDIVWRLEAQDKVDLTDLLPPLKSPTQFLTSRSILWFYACLTISLVTILAIYAIPLDSPLVALRWLLGSLFALFLPGYVAVKALFPKSMESIVRLALSVGLSIVLVMFVGLLLNYTPFGIRLTPITISLTIVTVIIGTIAVVRQYAVT